MSLYCRLSQSKARIFIGLSLNRHLISDMFLALTWRDHRLRLPGGNLSTLHFTSVMLLLTKCKGCWDADYRILDVNWIKDIWRPDCIFKNAKDIDFQVTFWNIYKEEEDILIVSCSTICPDFGVMEAWAWTNDHYFSSKLCPTIISGFTRTRRCSIW